MAIDIDDAPVIRRDMSKFAIVCDAGVECYPLGVFDLSVSAGDGHAKLFWNGDRLYIQDLGSSNGTFIVIDDDERPLPVPGWNARTEDDDDDERAPSEPTAIRKTRTVRIGTLAFTVEIETKSAINVTGDYLAAGASKIDVRDSVLQRSTIGGKAGAGGGGGVAPTEDEVVSQVEVRDSVVVRSTVTGCEMGVCPACGKPVAVEWKNCPYCCTALRE